ncbi:hypothetical protein [Fictibacillus sp. FJAT-27399]|uniref:hypothetical protein n=1 Tax=Fictibacillus sp. FJAT-27399 TaxID=1729689 RepID=UPI0007831F55|nr:hypothetical protein [Fictibacillus sp. FJAT-27399]
MSLKVVWKGSFPSYWDISRWAALRGEYLFLLIKNSGHRKLLIQSLADKRYSFDIPTSANVILGFYKDSIIIGRLQDARSHINLTNLVAYNFLNKELQWRTKGNFLYEKYKIPYINQEGYFKVGKDFINLETGKITTDVKLYGSEINLSPFKKNWFKGSIGNTLYFFDQNQSIYLTDNQINIMKSLRLENLKKVSNTIDGDFSIRSNNLLQNTNLMDALINKDKIVWVNNENNLVIYSLKDSLTRILTNPNKAYDLCLGSINEKYILIYGIKNYNAGSLLVFDLEDTNESKGKK